jgi:predicted Zn-dependent protease
MGLILFSGDCFMDRANMGLLPLMIWMLVLTTAVGCASDKQIIAQAANAHQEINPAVITDPALDKYIQTIGDRLVSTARELHSQGYGPKAHKSQDSEWMFSDIQFHLVNSPTLNAFTTGGQHVYLYSELFITAKTEDEFAAVVAHEFAHIYGRHVQKGTDRQYAVFGAAAAAAVGGAVLAGEDNRTTGALVGGGAGLAAGQFIGMGFTRGDEDEADKLGFTFYTRTGYDPARFGDFFQQMIDKGYDTTPEIASSHPKLSNRVENAKRRASELPPNAKQWRRPNVATSAQFADFQARAKKYQKTKPTDKTLQAAQLMLAAFPSCVAPIDQPSQIDARTKIARASQQK